ncbi:hypothetical protein [uncultured Paracoccus sp.]|uniref:hypothetical protein n=1 Tax=uncultured Paracoccus sp. TaxID=189685 RepID=UPI00262BEF3E|nr:hypothetical protein [uncultured Paracoccus sp.]
MKHKAFTEIVAHTCRVPQQTVTLFARNLKEAGLLTSGARGVNAPEMTVLDLARMTIALCATDRPSEAEISVRRYAGARSDTATTIAINEFKHEVPAGECLEEILTGILGLPFMGLRALNPEFEVSWSEECATLTIQRQRIRFAVSPEVEYPLFGAQGIRTTRGLGSHDLCEMALPFALEAEGRSTWEQMEADGSLQAVATRHIFKMRGDD